MKKFDQIVSDIHHNNPDFMRNILASSHENVTAYKTYMEHFESITKYIEYALDTFNIIEPMHKLYMDHFLAYTHSVRMMFYAIMYCKNSRSKLVSEKKLILSCFLHDIGKIKIPLKILKSKKQLNPSEWEIIKKHPIYSKQLLQAASVPDDIIDLCYHHHERINGSGYPEGLIGKNVGKEIQIVGLIDTLDSLVNFREYNRTYNLHEAFKIIDSDCQQGLYHYETFYELCSCLRFV